MMHSCDGIQDNKSQMSHANPFSITYHYFLKLELPVLYHLRQISKTENE